MRTMKPRRLAVAALISVALLAACGSDDSSSSSASAGAAGDAAQASRTADVEITATGYEPPTIEVAKGETVTFNVTNDDGVLHEFVLGNEGTQDTYAKSMTDMGSGNGTMEMPDTTNIRVIAPGQSKTITWTFPNEETKVIYGSHQVEDYKKYKGTITVK